MNDATHDAATAGVHHVGLTVPDIRTTRDFFVDVLGFRQVGDKPHYPAVFVSDGVVMLTLWQTTDPEACREFDRKNCVGLHHIALRVRTPGGLDALHARLAERSDVDVEFPPEPLGAAGTRHMMCAIPGGIRVELIDPEH